MKCLQHWQQKGKETELTHDCRTAIFRHHELLNAAWHPGSDLGTHTHTHKEISRKTGESRIKEEASFIVVCQYWSFSLGHMHHGNIRC